MAAVALPARTDVVVIGAGIIGAASAYYLTEAGLRVTLVERGDFCGEASGANVGLVTVSTKPPGLLLDLARRSVELYPELSSALGKSIDFEQTGSIIVALTPEGLAERRELTELQRSMGVEVNHVTGDEARELEPMLPDSVIGGSTCEQDGVVYPFSVVAGYVRRAQELGMNFVPHTEVIGISVEDGQVRGVQTMRGEIGTNHVVNAGGAWAGEISKLAGIFTPIVPVRGQVLVTEPVEGLPRRVILGVEPSIRATWAANGVIGSTKEYAGFQKLTTLETIEAFCDGLINMYPGLGDVQIIRSWSGLRPGTPDEMPILGESAHVRGFIVAGGSFRNGMLYGPAMGEVVRDLVLGRPPEIDISDSRLERFEQSAVAAAH